MDRDRSLEEGRRIGRSIYIVGSVALGLELYGVSLTESEAIPLKFPSDFPVSGVAALIVAFLTLALCVRIGDQSVRMVGAEARRRLAIFQQQKVDAAQLAAESIDLKHPTIAKLVFYEPLARQIAFWLIFFLDEIVPVIFAFFVLFTCQNSIYSLGHLPEPISVHRISGANEAKDKLMTSGLILKTSDGQSIPFKRWKNPDGSTGGLVASNSKIPQGTFIPFDTMIGDGVTVAKDTPVPSRSIVDKSGKIYPNEPVLGQ